MPDFDAIATAIANRYTAATITAVAGGPPAGLVNVRKATADLPNQLGALPAVLVFPASGDLRSANGTRVGEHSFFVRFYFAVTKDLPRELNACRRWLTILVDQLKGSVQLGGAVVLATVTTWRVGTLTYGAKDYTGLEIGVRVVTSEGWNGTA